MDTDRYGVQSSISNVARASGVIARMRIGQQMIVIQMIDLGIWENITYEALRYGSFGKFS